MLKINRNALKLAYDLGQLRNPPSPAVGSKSRTHCYTLQYDGGVDLGFWWTDNRTTIFGQLSVIPSDRTPWTVSATASIYRGPKMKPGDQLARLANGNEKRKPFDGEMDPRLRYWPEIMQSTITDQQDGSGGFSASQTRFATLTVDLKNAYRTLEGRKKVYLWLDWVKPETRVTRTLQTFEGRKKVRMREWEIVHDSFKGYLEPDFQLADMLAEQGPRTKVNIRTLWKTLRFLAKGLKGRDLDDPRKTCTLFQDGTAMAADSSRRGNAVVLVAKLPKLPFEVTVRKNDVETIVKWLRLVAKNLGSWTHDVEIIDLTATARPRYCFMNHAGTFRLWISAISRPFCRAVIDPTITPRFAVEVDRRSLWVDANLLGRHANGQKLLCAVVMDESGTCKLHIRGNSNDPLPSQDVLDATLLAPAGSNIAVWGFAVYARDLIAALRYFSAEKVLLVSRPAAQNHVSPQADHGRGWLEVGAATVAGDPTLAATGPKAFVRIMPSPMSGVVACQRVAEPVQTISAPTEAGSIQTVPTQIQAFTAADAAEKANGERNHKSLSVEAGVMTSCHPEEGKSYLHGR